MNPLDAVLAFIAGGLAGILASGFRLLHLEMEWHQVRTDLRRYYQHDRHQRVMEIKRREKIRPEEMTDQQIRDLVAANNRQGE